MGSVLMFILFSLFALFPMIVGEPVSSRVFGPVVTTSKTGEHYVWGVLLLVSSSEREAAELEDAAKYNRTEP